MFKDKLNARSKMIMSLSVSSIIIILTILLSYILSNDNLLTDLSQKSLPPNFKNFFGTEWLGRDMLTRT